MVHNRKDDHCIKSDWWFSQNHSAGDDALAWNARGPKGLPTCSTHARKLHDLRAQEAHDARGHDQGRRERQVKQVVFTVLSFQLSHGAGSSVGSANLLAHQSASFVTDAPTHSHWLNLFHKTEFHLPVCVCLCWSASVCGCAWNGACSLCVLKCAYSMVDLCAVQAARVMRRAGSLALLWRLLRTRSWLQTLLFRRIQIELRVSQFEQKHL